MTSAAIEPRCPRCHDVAHDLVTCPYVKAIEWNEMREISRVEFLTPADYGRPVIPVNAADNYAKKGAA